MITAFNHHFCQRSSPLKKLPQCHHCTMTLSRMQPKAIPSALLSAMLLLPLDNTTAVANAYWLLIVIFGCCWDLSFSRKLPVSPITICIVNTYHKTLPSLPLVLFIHIWLVPNEKEIYFLIKRTWEVGDCTDNHKLLPKASPNIDCFTKSPILW